MATRTWLGGSDNHATTVVDWANGLPQSGDVLNITTGGTVDFSGLTGDFSATIVGPLEVSGTVDLSNGPTRIGPAQSRFINSGTIDLANSKIDADLAGGGTFAITPVHDIAGVSTSAGTTEIGGTVQAGVILELEGEDNFAANLIIDKPQSQQFFGLLEVRSSGGNSGKGSTGSDEITLKGLTATSYAFANNTLTLFDGPSEVTTIRLDSTLPLTVTQDTAPGVLPNVTLHFGNSAGPGTILPLASTPPTPTPPPPVTPPAVSGPTPTFAHTSTVTTPNQMVTLGVGGTQLTLQSTGTHVIGGSGNDFIVDGGGADTINLGSGSTTIAGAGGGPMVFGSSVSGSLLFSGGTAAATVFAGVGASTVFANGGGGEFFGGGGSTMLFVGGSGASTATGGSGSSILFGGSSGRDVLVAGTGASTVIGAGSGITIVGHGTAGDNLVAGSGSEDLVGSGDGGNDIMFAGSGADRMFAGSGNDTFVAATGGAQMVAGPGNDLFTFSNGAAGSANAIFNFTQGQDHVALFGYGTNAVADALAHASVAFGSTSITLADNTTITFANVTNLHSTDFL